ncbi:MAG: MATE family efflux transporter [Firmicutes bacterium]|nr:MATE family efflux transporter [Bacillota bacterium]
MPRKLPIFYSALMLTGVNLLLRLAGTTFQVYLSSRIGAEGIGLLQLVMSVGSMALVAGMAGIRTATMYLTAEDLGRKKPGSVVWVLSGCVAYSVLCSSAVAAGIYVYAPVLASRWIGSPDTVDSLRLFAAFLPVNCLAGVMAGYFTGANRIGTLAAVEVAEQICSMICTVSLLTLWAGHDAGRSCQAVVLGSGLGTCLTLSCLVILRLLERNKASRPLPVARRLLQTVVPLALADDLRTGITTLENLMVPKRLALYGGVLSPLAAFGTVCGMVFPILMFPVAILYGLTELLIPELARCRAAGSGQRVSHLVQKSLRVALLYGTVCGGLLFLNADALCRALYKSDEAGTYLRWFSLLAVMLYCDTVTDAMIKGLGQQKHSVCYNILTNTMDVAFLYILLPRYGIRGYFASFLVTHVINFRLSIGRLLKITGERIPPRVPVLTLTAAVFALWVSGFLSAPLLRTGAFLTVLTCLLFLLKILSREDLIWLKGLICKK